jgi:CRISPR-associated protein (TIGR03986 family)
MADFYLPYHFIPVVKDGLKGDLPSAEFGNPERMEGTRHDVYLPDTHSGTIECTLEAASAIFIGHQKDDTTKEVMGFKLDGRPAIPASSLRGLVSCLAEAASNSAARVLSRNVLGQPCYSYRKPMREPLSAVGMLSREGEHWKLEPVCLPLLQYDNRGRLTREMAKWKRVFVKEPVFRVFAGGSGGPHSIWDPAFGLRTTSVANKLMPLHRLAWADVETLSSAARQHLNAKPAENPRTVVAQRPDATGPNQKCLVRVLGCYERDPQGDPLRQLPKPDKKKHELFLPFQPGRFRKLPVPHAALEKFQQLADQMTEQSKRERSPRPYEPKDTRPGRAQGEPLKPQAGDLVFFDVDEQSLDVTEISYSSIWRDRVETLDGRAANAWTFFEKVDPELVPFHPGRQQITVAERLFGFVEEKEGKELRNGLRLKGRVRFSPALSSDPVTELPLVPLKELSSPKPPSPALYFRNPQGRNVYIPKSRLTPGTHAPQGRKVYLHHPAAIQENAAPWHNREHFEADRHVKVRPWAKGAKWRFEVRFDNLSDLELGLLLYALTPSPEFRHKIGMGKPLGLGSVRIDVEKVLPVLRPQRYTADGWSQPRFSAELAWQQLRNQFRGGMNPTIRTAIEVLGDPAKVDTNTEITYPRVDGQQKQDELYKWFVSNDQQKEPAQQVALQPVDTRIPKLPRLRPPR